MQETEERILRFLIHSGRITEEDKDVYRYALQSVWILGGNIVTSLFIGILLGHLGYCLLLLLTLIPLRSDAGGYHAPNVWQCYFMSCGVLVAALLWIRAQIPFQTEITVFFAAVSFFFVFRFAPLAAENKPLDERERKIIGRRARITLVLELVAGLLCLGVDQKVAYSILSAIIWCGVGYAGWFLEKYVQRRGCE